MRLSINGTYFAQDGSPTYSASTGFPNADPRLAGLLLNHRAINGIFDDLNTCHDYDGDGADDWAYADTGEWDADRNTELFCGALVAWRERGVIAFTIGLQGGNPFKTCPPPAGLSPKDIDCGAFEADGSLRPAFMVRLRRVLDRAKELDMAPIVNYFYQNGIHRLREECVGAAIDNATQWLLERGYDGLIIDLVNECGSEAYWPSLRLDAVHEMVYRVKDNVDLYNTRTRNQRTFYVGTSLLPRWSVAEKVAALPTRYIQAVDLLMPHGNGLSTERIREAIAAMRARIAEVARQPMPIVYNEDIQATPDDPDNEDNGGDLAHFDTCLELDVSWGNLIRSHQQVPCEDWVEGSEVQRAWFEKTSALAGTPKPPHSVSKLYYRI